MIIDKGRINNRSGYYKLILMLLYRSLAAVIVKMTQNPGEPVKLKAIMH